jgi:hypothetical protein
MSDPTRNVATVQPTQAVVSKFSRVPVTPLAGTSGLNQGQLAAAGAPTRFVKSGQGRNRSK